ncbi:MAG: 2Fe-2S iron-sulfur cluster binding domain-containing protein, partial [Paenibacillaceae bacterium]|nr:2Fe-2S iron-sulfur cluster binding domain-containing protein [Paenibacillaceae bacterium]
MWLTIDNKQIEAKEGMSVLNAALGAGIYIPHLCGHPDLEAIGGCRLCSVEIEGMDQAVPSCMIKVQDGMKVSVHGPKAESTRKTAMELILATHPADCTGCPKYGKCELQSMYQYLGVGPERWKKKARTVPTDDSNPLIRHLFTRCVRCGRCVRACRDLRGVKVLDFQKTEDGVRI